MCRILGIRSTKPISPSVAVSAMRTMQLGHDNSGFALMLQDLGGEFEPYRHFPALSMACTRRAQRKVEDYLEELGFVSKFDWLPHDHDSPEFRQGLNVKFMPKYVFRFYRFPKEPKDYERASKAEQAQLLVETTSKLREIEDAYIYSFWPDVLTIKEIGDPWDISTFFGLTQPDDNFVAKCISVQCRQNTNYDIVRYAAHPFFLEGYTLMGNGEDTMYTRNREYLAKLHPAYRGFESDTQCFLYTLHYVTKELGWPLEYFKHVITPLSGSQRAERPADEQRLLEIINNATAFMEINGPNTVIAVTPDGAMFTTCDSKKLRPVVVRYDKDTAIFSSEVCAAEVVLPRNEGVTDIYPTETEVVKAIPDENGEHLEVTRWNQ